MQKTLNSELNRIDTDEFKLLKKTPIVVVLDNIRSLNNVGSVFRTCDAFAIETIYLCGITGTPPHRDIEKTALGATDSVNWVYSENTESILQNLKQDGYSLIAIEQAAESIMLDDATLSSNEKIAFIFGNEVNGVSQEVMDMIDICLEIPQFGTKHSFNISVSVGIVLWQFYNLRKNNSQIDT